MMGQSQILYCPFIIYRTFIITMKASNKRLKQKHIQDFLQDIEDFKFGEKGKMSLEQHLTPPNLAAQLLFYIYNNEPIEQYTVADIGVGTGMLMCGAIFLEAKFVVGVEIDAEYIEQTRQMLDEKVQGADYDLILADARHIKFKENTKPVDLVIMNPPFGTKQTGIDVQFLKLAMSICGGNIYSMHKTSTRKYLQKFSEQNGYDMEVIIEVKFPLKKRFKGYHKKDVGYTQVDVIVLRPKKQEQKMQQRIQAQKRQKKQQEES